MSTVNIHEAKTHLSRLLEAVAAGEEVIIAKAGKPIAKLVPIEKPKCKPGALKGTFIETPSIPDCCINPPLGQSV